VRSLGASRSTGQTSPPTATAKNACCTIPSRMRSEFRVLRLRATDSPPYKLHFNTKDSTPSLQFRTKKSSSRCRSLTRSRQRAHGRTPVLHVYYTLRTTPRSVVSVFLPGSALLEVAKNRVADAGKLPLCGHFVGSARMRTVNATPASRLSNCANGEGRLASAFTTPAVWRKIGSLKLSGRSANATEAQGSER
jgi:hypothetical protein